MSGLKSTLLHTLELVVCVGVAWFVLTFFSVDSETVKLVVGVVLNALVKFNRASDKSPINDYVNNV